MPPRPPSPMEHAALAAAVRAIGTPSHVERLIDLVEAIVPGDMVTVTRYALRARPEFIAHRNFDDALVKHYLDNYHVHDPFSAYWRSGGRPGVVHLLALAGPDVRRGRYVAEFLRQSVIADELGVLLDDGSGWCLGVFLDRRERRFSAAEAARLEAWFPVLAALHARHREIALPPPPRVSAPAPAEGRVRAGLPAGLWPELSARERQIVDLVLAGHPSASIAQRLGITTGTVKNHRRRIYAKLDITTERELFLQYFEHAAGSR